MHSKIRSRSSPFVRLKRSSTHERPFILDVSISGYTYICEELMAVSPGSARSSDDLDIAFELIVA